MDFNQTFQYISILMDQFPVLKLLSDFLCSRNDKTGVNYSVESYNDFFFSFLSIVLRSTSFSVCLFLPCQR